MKRVSKRQLDKFVVIEFLDHVQGGDGDLLKCRVVGRVKSTTSSTVVLSVWDSFDEDGNYDTDNEETFTIAQSTISDVRVLK